MPDFCVIISHIGRLSYAHSPPVPKRTSVRFGRAQLVPTRTPSERIHLGGRTGTVRAGSTSMKYTVYVVKDKFGKLYKGLTTNIKRGLQEHKHGYTKSTSGMKSVEIVYTEVYDNLVEAREREKYLKTAAGRRFLKFKKNIRP